MVRESSGTIDSILYATEKGRPRQQADSALLKPDWGIEGDAYAGPGERQLLLFWSEAREEVDTAENQGLCYPRFRENLLIRGLDPGTLRPGDRLRAGDTLLRVTEASKRCYPECELPKRECQIRGHVAFCAVEKGGAVAVETEIWLLPPEAP